jgi:HSP20 family protein
VNKWDFEEYWGLEDYKVTNTDEEGKVEIEVPGVDKEDISIEVKGNYLHVEYKDYKYKCERQKTFGIKRVKTDEITAKLDKGILTITLPLIEKEKPRKIEIE